MWILPIEGAALAALIETTTVRTADAQSGLARYPFSKTPVAFESRLVSSHIDEGLGWHDTQWHASPRISANLPNDNDEPQR